MGQSERAVSISRGFAVNSPPPLGPEISPRSDRFIFELGYRTTFLLFFFPLLFSPRPRRGRDKNEKGILNPGFCFSPLCSARGAGFSFFAERTRRFVTYPSAPASSTPQDLSSSGALRSFISRSFSSDL